MKVLLSTVALLGCLALALVGCGGGGSSSRASADTAATESAANEPGPEIKVPSGPPPRKVVVKELKKGTGTEAKRGYQATIRYVSVDWNGTPYSNSWDQHPTPSFVLGAHELTMPGLDKGIRGMKVGGRREIIIPPEDRYYPGDPRPSLSRRQETLVYVVDLLKAVPEYAKLRALNGLTSNSG